MSIVRVLYPETLLRRTLFRSSGECSIKDSPNISGGIVLDSFVLEHFSAP